MTDFYEIYTDGAASGNGTKDCIGGFAAIVYRNGELIEEYGKSEKGTTNNAMEMKAILWALGKYGKLSPTIYSDSAYAINSFTVWRPDWKRAGWCKKNGGEILNLDLIKAYDMLEGMGFKGNIVKVKGHKDCEGNILADKLARQQVELAKTEQTQEFDFSSIF